jgi:hypothetical protein
VFLTQALLHTRFLLRLVMLEHVTNVSHECYYKVHLVKNVNMKCCQVMGLASSPYKRSTAESSAR